MGERASRRWALAAILAVALIARVAVVAATPGYVPASDAHDYDTHAVSIANGDGYPDTFHARPGTESALRPPAYPHLLGAVYAVAGDHSWHVARLAGALLGVLTVLLVSLVGRELAGPRVALVAAALAAVFPPLVMLNASLVSEALFVPLELAAVAAALAYRRDPRLRWAIACGALCGLAALTRTVGVLVLAAAAVGLWRAAPRPRAVGAVAAAAAAALVVAPWTVRNALALDAFVPISTQGGITAAGTYNSESDRPGRSYAVWRPPQSVREFAPLFKGGRDEADLNAELGSAARRYALDHPTYVGAATALNALRTVDLGPAHTPVTRVYYGEMGIPRDLWGLTSASAWIVLALAAVGIAVARRWTHPGLAWVWLVPALTYLASIPISGGARYRAPADPFLVLLAAAGLLALARAAARRPE